MPKCLDRMHGRDPNNLMKLGSAIRAIHIKFRQNRDRFSEICKVCKKERDATPPNPIGRSDQLFAPLIRRKGNPIESVEWDNAVVNIQKEIKGYKPNCSSQLTPTEILILTDYCMKENSAYFFMIYIIFLLLLKLFLRNDDGKKSLFR